MALTAIDPAFAVSAAIFLLVVGIGISRRPQVSVGLYAWMAVPQAVLLAALAVRGGAPLLWVDVAVTLFVKGVWVPRVLRGRLVRSDPPDHGWVATASPALLLMGTAVVAALSLRLGALLAPGGGLALGLLLAAMLLGFGAPCVRRELWAQAAGILGGEGALAAGLFVLVGRLPLLLEGLALAEALGLAVVLGAVVRFVNRVHGRPDVRLLERLKG